ncbi:hypothetical protein SAMN05518672_10315 [Chitinophaga sp. CF118]|uniref:hypothetical protein n=1 Tax=Chitinophaga sp. CF118 TaxID=1884367 RepID=UPI0008E11097|nr:hypothetical protein [Chitinophaga sp. CF118]SFD73914.1 hypothetical protein SAMN05518672_10315 [Chitinophaga sp. CF118]
MPELKFITTDKNSGFPEYLDFATLRKLGIQHLAEFSGKIWTDHNLHDPGITMLEALCYVLTDLDYRTKLDFKDLIAVPAGASEDNFYTAAQILGNNPLTITDIRRMLIDIKGVRNAWVELPADDEYSLSFNCDTGELLNVPATEGLTPIPLKGLYRILIEPDDVYAAAYEQDACGNSVFPLDTVLTAIDQRLHGHRNLCEDFAEVLVMEKEPISFCIHIELAANFDPNDVLVNVYSSIQDFFSPAPVFYTLQQLLDKGRSMEEIFEGRAYDFINNEPLQQNGFIDAKELESLERLTEIHASDLYRIIMGIPGVAGITRLQMTSFDEDGYELIDKDGKPIVVEGAEWCLKLKKDHRPVLSPETSNVIFFRNKISFTANKELVQQRFIKSISDYNKFNKKPAELDTIIPKGRQLDLAQYTSVQYEFPKVYMVGKNEVPHDETAARKAQSLQLQGYLLFYDRLLADYFAQLANIRQLFSLGQDEGQHTYFMADISGIPQLPSLLRYEKKLQGTFYNGMQLAYEPDEDGVTRKEYSTMYLRDEMIRRIISESSNNSINREVVQVENDTSWYILLTDTAGNVLLRGTVFFSTETEAEQAARDIAFLVTLPDSYSRINNRLEEKFSFDLVYNDAGSTEMLTVLYETSAQYEERKERFQNHLLARFSEDFTDYALMMYNISGKKNDPESSIQDKGAFLTAYPETSANRARAFDYKHPSEGFPVYGLQKRIGGLMGIRRSPSVSLNNFDLVTAIKQTGFVVKLPHQNTPLFISDSLHKSEDITTVFKEFLTLGQNKNNYKSYGCPGEGVFGFYIQSPLYAEEWIAARFSVEYTTAAERDEVVNWMVQFFKDDGQYKVYPQTQEGYYFQLPDDYGKILLKAKQGYATEEEALAEGYNLLEILQDDNNWDVIPDISNFRIVIFHNKVQVAYHPLTFGTEESALIKMEDLQKYFHRHNLVYQKETTELYNWQMTDAGKPAWEGMFPFKSMAQLPVAFTQFVELAAKPENYRITDLHNLQVIRTETGDDAIETIMATHLWNYATEEDAQKGINHYVALFSSLWLTVSGTVKEVSASVYYFKDSEATGTILLTSIPVPDGPGVAPFTRHIERLAAEPQHLTVVPASGCRYNVQLHDEYGQLMAESQETNDYASAVNLMQKILSKAGNDALWVEKGTSVDAYGFLWEDDLLQSFAVWESQQVAATAFLSWVLDGQPDIVPEYQSGNGYGYTIFTKNKVPLAKQVKWYATADQRDDAILQIMQQLSALLGNTGLQPVTLYHYYFKIREDNGFLLLQEPQFYPGYNEVRTAFYNTVKFGKHREYYQLTTRENCTYGFNVIDPAQVVLAVHPQEYTSIAARDAAVERTIRFLQERGQAVTDVKLVGAWQYNWQWLSCCCWYPEVALEGLDEKPEKQEAIDALQYILNLALTVSNYKSIQEENGWRVYLFDGENRIAVHPRWYDCERAAEDARDRLIDWASFKLSDLDKADYSYEQDVRTDLYKQGDLKAVIGYRLWDREFRIARYGVQFDTEEKRTAVLEQLLQRYHRKLPSYTTLEKGNSAVVFQNGQYYFQLRRNDLLLWQSITGYGDATAAATAFRDNCWNILQRSLNKANYSFSDAGLFLNDVKGQPIAVYTGTTESHDAAIQIRQLFALKHGVYLTSDNTFAFHIYNAITRMYDWESTHTYTNPDDAAAALLEFVQLLSFRGNYSLDNETVGCYYSINIGKVLLDIQRVTEKCEGDTDQVSANDAWDRLQVFLDKREPNNDNFFPYTNYAAGCRYAFHMVDSSVYRVAQHTGWYQGMEKREEVRMQLLADIFCKEKLYGWFVNPDAKHNEDRHILDCYFPHPENVKFESLWMSYDQIPSLNPSNVDKLWMPAEELLTGVTSPLHYYQLTDTGGKVIWSTITRYATAALAEAAEQYFYVFLLEMARSASSYYYEPMPGCENAFTLFLKDMDGKVIAVAPDVICKADIEQDRATRMFNAMMFPIMESGSGYRFEINDVLQSDDLEYDYTTIWESEQIYNTPDEARTGLNKACDLLLLLQNYRRGDENSCGPYGIALVNPDGILASHPLTYTSMSARNTAIEEVQAAISSEGFHMLEHILLRPRSQPQTYENLQLTLNWNSSTVKVKSEMVFPDGAAFLETLKKATGTYEDKSGISWWKGDEKIAFAVPDKPEGFLNAVPELLSAASTEDITTETISLGCDDADTILPVCNDVCVCDCDQGEIDEENKIYCDTTYLADPYSFWATVVLPAWPERFRLARFRQFFEDTLRREAPAHIRLNILWISPQQMLQFEDAWRLWLAAVAREDSCDYNTSLTGLNDVLKSLKNVFPAAYLYDDEGGDNKPLIILDEAMLG